VKKKGAIIILLTTIMFCVYLQSCKKEETNDGKSFELLKTVITEKYINHASYSWDQYKELLTELSNEKYVVLPMYLMKDFYDSTKVVVGMRHDVDVHIFKALEMAEIEYLYGIRSTYYILGTAYYYGSFSNGLMVRNKCMGDMYLRINFLGHEIGIHNDLLTVMIQYKNDPFLFNQEELDYYKSLGIIVYGTASHGSQIARETVANYQIFSDFATKSQIQYNGREYPIAQHSLSEYGYTYEAYFVDYDKYYSDAGGDWNFEGDFEGVLNSLHNSKPGDRIQILTHPVWWGKE